MLKALVIDDVQENLQYFEDILRKFGFKTLLAESAEAALKLVDQHLDVIFLDYNMPGMDGFEFIEVFRNIPRHESVPIIMISTDLAVNQTAVRHGLAQAWLIKRPSEKMVEGTLKKLGVMSA